MAKVMGIDVGTTNSYVAIVQNDQLQQVVALDPQVQLLIPDEDVDDPEISIVIPAMNERITIEDFVEWCKTGLDTAGVKGEILIVDSSSDETPQLALARGARSADAAARSGSRLHRRDSLHPRQVRINGRCRLYLRFPRDFRLRRAIPGRL